MISADNKESKTNIKVSVIIAAFNQEKFIGRCLRSLLHQTLDYADYEIIVVNDGSSDLTSYALKLFSDPSETIVNVISNKKNIGLPASLNKALKIARGPFVVRVDADDFVNKNFLNFLLYYLDANQHVDAVACDYLLLDDEEKEIRRCDCNEEPIGCGIMFTKNICSILAYMMSPSEYGKNENCGSDFQKNIKFLV